MLRIEQDMRRERDEFQEAQAKMRKDWQDEFRAAQTVMRTEMRTEMRDAHTQMHETLEKLSNRLLTPSAGEPITNPIAPQLEHADTQVSPSPSLSTHTSAETSSSLVFAPTQHSRHSFSQPARYTARRSLSLPTLYVPPFDPEASSDTAPLSSVVERRRVLQELQGHQTKITGVVKRLLNLKGR